MNSYFALIFWLVISLVNGQLILSAFNYLIKTDSRWWKQCVLFFSCWLLDTTIIYVGDPFNILAVLPCFLTAVLLCCRGSRWKRITLGLMYACTLFSFNAIRDNFLHSFVYYILADHFTFKHLIYAELYTDYGEYSADLLMYAAAPIYTQYLQVFNGISSLLFALFLYGGIRKFAPDKDYSLSDRLWRLLLLLTATPFGVVLSLVLFFDDDGSDALFSMTGALKYVVLLSFTLLSFVSLLWCISVLAGQQKLERQNLLAETNRKYYEAMEQQHFEIRRLKHDLANHLQILTSLPAAQRDAYIRNLSRLPAAMEPLSYCGDATVNAVLSVKKTTMDRCGICAEISADIPAELPFDRIDVCALYANALDNAIEACIKLDETRRVITVKSRARKGLFCLEVSNPVSNDAIMPQSADVPDISGTSGISEASDTLPDPERQNRPSPLKSACLPPTTKEDKANHGFGLKGMEEIVSRYHGSMEWNSRDGIFELFLYLPLEHV